MAAVQTVIPTFDGPAFLALSELRSARYRSEPYARVRFPDGVSVDGKAVRWSRTHALMHWVPDPAGPPREAWVPLGWCEWIGRDDSAWRDPYDVGPEVAG